jgi:hypothetical protein
VHLLSDVCRLVNTHKVLGDLRGSVYREICEVKDLHCLRACEFRVSSQEELRSFPSASERLVFETLFGFTCDHERVMVMERSLFLPNEYSSVFANHSKSFAACFNL